MPMCPILLVEKVLSFGLGIRQLIGVGTWANFKDNFHVCVCINVHLIRLSLVFVFIHSYIYIIYIHYFCRKCKPNKRASGCRQYDIFSMAYPPNSAAGSPSCECIKMQLIKKKHEYTKCIHEMSNLIFEIIFTTEHILYQGAFSSI